jgi:hypothetical protein
MKLPLRIRWVSGSGVGEALTESENVSSRGIYFFLQKTLREGSPIELVMTLPHEITHAGPVRVRCLGRVLRTEPRPARKVGVVVGIERYEFLRSDQTAA